MKNKFEKYIADNQLFTKDDKLIVAVSGGVDSVVLGQLLYLNNYSFSVVHCNFQLRGQASEEDEQFVKDLATHWKSPFYVKKFDTEKYASDHKVSIQLAARELRYEWFETLRQSLNYDYILTAHHASDSIETVLFNFAKGTGLLGLTGIKPKNNHIVRPLLWATKEEILAFLEMENLLFREDSSNISDKYARNFIRHHIVPDFKNINPSFEKTAIENIQRLAEAKDLLDFTIQEIKKEIVKNTDNQWFIDKNKLKTYPSVSTILFELLKDFGFNSAQILQILAENEFKTGTLFYSPTHKLLIDRDQYIVAQFKEKESQQAVFMIKKEDKIIYHEDFQLSFDYTIAKTFTFSKNENSAILDAQKLKFPLLLRKWQQGDRFQPLGLGGKSQLLSDFFRLKKLTAFDKDKVWVLETADRQICWVVNFRLDERFKITDESTSFVEIRFDFSKKRIN